ncbi:hypothetical protein BGZ83_009683 [Gryganskiella cystojenkinii]|nr:hypothetical protein BGZ83_009683 [Gryganskiella cystojenkinii]
MSDQVAFSPFSPVATTSPHVAQDYSFTGAGGGPSSRSGIGPMDVYMPSPNEYNHYNVNNNIGGGTSHVTITIDDTAAKEPAVPCAPPSGEGTPEQISSTPVSQTSSPQPQDIPQSQSQQQQQQQQSQQDPQFQQQQQHQQYQAAPPPQQYHQQQPSYSPSMGGYDPHQTMAPLQPLLSNQSAIPANPVQSFQSASSALSTQSANVGPDQRSPPSHANHGHHLQPPAPEKGRSRRWSLTGRFFEKRKSVTEPFHIPNSHPQQIAASYEAHPGQSNIVYGNGGAGTNQPSQLSSSFNGTGSTMEENLGKHNSNTSSGTAKQLSPPGSNGGSRRSSLADIPKAFLSSWRRGSFTPSTSSSESSNMAAAIAAAAGGSISPRAGDNDEDDDGGSPEDDDGMTAGQAHMTMAVPKKPPQDAWTLAHMPAPKSILKKRPSSDPASAPNGTQGGIVASAAIAGAGPGGMGNGGANSGSSLAALGPETVHPMATSDMDVIDINLLAPTDHRARLLTHSPTPNHPQQHTMAQHDQLAMSPDNSNYKHHVDPNNNNFTGGKIFLERYSASSQGAAIPPDFTPGVQSNSNRGGERPPGAVTSMGQSQTASAAAAVGNMSQDEMLTNQMYGTISARAQDLANQYYGLSGANGANTNGHPNALQNSGATGQKRRSINFLETIEIIPALRKSEYNRQSDKHATFKILTPDLKSEIRDELNTYKMREMAVHVESMGNTAFH